MIQPHSDTVYDAAIVGGGPAGASAARRLALRGAKCILLEKHASTRYKPCGGGITARTLQVLDVDIRPAIERMCCTAELNFVGSGAHFPVERAEPILLMTMRSAFDDLLLQSAIDAGAEVRRGERVVDFVTKPSCVEIRTPSSAILARFVIGADGAASAVAGKAGWRETRFLAPSVEWEVKVGEAAMKRLSATARFDFDILPSGYAWVFPKKEHLSIGMMSARRGHQDLPDAMRNYLAFLGIADAAIGEKGGALLPLSFRPDGFARNRFLLAGDAAGLVDPITGEGISFAIESGQIAADALVEGNFDEGKAGALYAKQLERRILSELRIRRRLSWIAFRSRRIRSLLFRCYGNRIAQAMTDVTCGNLTYAKALRNPGNFLKMLGVAPRHRKGSRGDS